ncbi:hypothetical protein [Saccharothrix variisporea]|uniref:hypothetical protein n=1 Tax=Saccharothrix variisporea TaxID=543527 RepID=UPI0011C49BD6|nr:hypothetical protein [Saccharothrix variisporea]
MQPKVFARNEQKVLAAPGEICGRLRQAIRGWHKQEAPALSLVSILGGLPAGEALSLFAFRFSLFAFQDLQAERFALKPNALRALKIKSGWETTDGG